MHLLQASPQSHRALGLLRIIVGLLFMAEGTMKWFGYPPPPSPMPHITTASLLGIAGLIEMSGGLLIAIGLFTRPVAFILSGEMAVAYFHTHFPHGFFPMTNNGMPAVLFCFLFLYLSFSGAGAWSFDHRIGERSEWQQSSGKWRDFWHSGRVRPIRVRR
jgi:putative oxidoreductase